MTKRNEMAEDIIEAGPAKRIKSDADLQYLHNYERDDQLTRDLVYQAQQSEVPYYVRDKWDSKYNLLEPKELQKFASNIYDNYYKTKPADIELECSWKLLYCARGTVLYGLSDGFYGELYFNSEKHCLLLAIKGTSGLGNKWSDIKNVGLQFGGGEIDSAFTFGEKVRELIMKFKCKPLLMITGHSLGGYLAQITTYTLKYCYLDKEGRSKSRDTPNDDLKIYTVVFDSPAALKQILELDQRDPIRPIILSLPIVNFVVNVNIINSNSVVGPHLGQVVAVKSFQDLHAPSKWKRMWNVKFHVIKKFQNINIDEFHQVEYLPDKKSITNYARAIPSCVFSVLNFERLHKYLFLADMSAELANKLPKFQLSNSCIVIEDETLTIEEFIPRVHHFLAQDKDLLDSGILNGKQIVDMVAFNLWRAGMLKDAHELSLDERWKKIIDQWPDGKKIGGFESHEEMRFFGCLLHNSIPRCFHYNYDELTTLDCEIVENFLATTKGVLVLIVKDENQINKQLYEQQKQVKIFYLILNSADNSNINMFLFWALDEKSQDKLKQKELKFMGNEVCALQVFGNKLLENLPVLSIYSFHLESALQDDFFYYNQKIVSEDRNSKFKSATEFAHELSKGKPKFVMIASDAGMGKSTALKQIAKTLQNHLQNYWIVHLNLFSLQNELNEEKEKLISKAEAIAFVRNALLADRKEDEVLKNVFDWKVEAQEMVLCLDSLDEICPLYRETADSLLSLLKETGVQIVLTTRPHEGRNFKEAQIFSVEPLDQWRVVERFVLQKFEMMGKQPPSDIYFWLGKIPGESHHGKFWRVPLILNMAINIYDPIQLIEAASDKIHKTNIYNTFFIKSISNTLEKKFGLNKSSATCLFQEKFNLYNKLIHILAICTIFHSGNVTQEFEKIIEDNRDSIINRFDLAKVFDFNKVAFVHRSFAEYLIAKLFVQNQQEKSCEFVLLNDKQKKSILFDEEFSETRNHICTILAVNPIKLKSLSGCINNGEAKLLSILIREDRYEMYLALNDLLSSQLNKIILWSFEYSTNEEQYPLYFALLYARKEFVHQLVDDGALFEAILLGEYVLHRAIKKGLYKEVMNHFESLKSNINEIYGMTPLAIAVNKGIVEMVEFLIEKGADVNIEMFSGKHTALYFAIQANNTELVALLTANKADSTKALNWAAELKRMEIFDNIYENYAPSESKVKRLNESLFYAVKEGHFETVKHLCAFPEANPREVDEDGNTFLHVAAERGHIDCMEVIFEYQQPQSIDVRNAAGQTPLLKACEESEVEMIKWLLDKNAEVNAVDNEGKSCLHYDMMSRDEDSLERVIDFLVNAGADINLKDENGTTPLMSACGENDDHELSIDKLKCFLKHSPDVNLIDNYGNTCLQYLYSEDTDDYMEDAVKLLLEHRAAVNLENHEGETPLHLFAYRGNVDIVELLLEAGKEQNVEARDGETILRLARKMFKIKYADCFDESEELDNESDDESEESKIDSEISRWRYIVKDSNLSN